MRLGLLLLVAGLLVVGVAAGSAEDQEEARRRKAEEAQREERPNLSQVELLKVKEALKDRERWWAMLTAPETPYLERRAAAVQGAKLLPFEWLPRLMAARRRLRKEEGLHLWGLGPHTLWAHITPSFPQRLRVVQDLPGGRDRSLLGQVWRFPEQEGEWPLLWQEEARAPWPWQVLRALDDLFLYASGRWDPLSDQDADRWLGAAIMVPCETDEEAEDFVEACNELGSRLSLPVLARWRRLALDPRFPQTAKGIACQVFGVRLARDRKDSTPAQVLYVDMFRRSSNQAAKDQAAYLWGGGREFMPASLLLATGESVLDDKGLSPWSRLYLAFHVCKAVGDPPFQPDYHMDMNSPRVPEQLAAFQEWFKAREKGYRKQAAAEEPALEKLRTELEKMESTAYLDAAPKRAEKPVTKGYELYSWREPEQLVLVFVLLPGTNRNKTLQEIAAAPKIRGVSALKAELDLLAPGENVFWFHDRVPADPDVGVKLVYPDGGATLDILRWAKRPCEIELHMPEEVERKANSY